jgi:hypothetical protein
MMRLPRFSVVSVVVLLSVGLVVVVSPGASGADRGARNSARSMGCGVDATDR